MIEILSAIIGVLILICFGLAYLLFITLLTQPEKPNESVVTGQLDRMLDEPLCGRFDTRV